MECNAQVLNAEARKVDLRMKGVGKDIIKAATIIIKSLTVLDKVTQDDGHAAVAREVTMINGALALLSNTNFHNNLTRQHIIKQEINQKYSHLCSDKVPMTRLLFGDDISQSTKQIEEAEKLKNKISTKKTFSPWKFGANLVGGKPRGFFGKTPFRGFSSRFHPYGQHRADAKGEQRLSYPRHDSASKNFRGRGHSNPSINSGKPSV